jgi:hypothetical protein
MATLANLENLMTAYDAVVRAQFVEWNGSRETSPARLESCLFSAAVECGMDRDHDDLEGWAAERVTRFLCTC